MLEREKVSLVVVDIQGKLAEMMYNKEFIYKNASIMIQGSQILDIPIYRFEQLPDKLGKTIPQIEELFEGKEPIVKSTFSCCGEGNLIEQLNESRRKQVLLLGIETHVCVYQTARDLLNKGFEVHLVADAVSSRTKLNRKIGIEKIREMGGKITSTEMALFELLKVAGTDEFRKISKLVK